MAIRFTHGYDLIIKIGTMVGSIMVVTAGAQLLGPIADPVEEMLKSHDLEWGWGIITLIYWIGGYIGAIVLLGKTILPYWLPTYRQRRVCPRRVREAKSLLRVQT